MSIVSVLVALALAGVLAAAIGTFMSNAIKGSASVERQIDREQIRSLIFQSIDCSETLKSAKITDLNSATQCASTSASQSGPYLRLARKTPAGWRWLSGEVGANGSRLGDWFVRVSCSASEQSLVVRLARAKPDGSCCGKDPLTEKTLDWSHPKSLLFGGASAAALPLCYDSGDSGPTIVTGTVSATGQGAGANCNSSLENIGKLYLLGSGEVGWAATIVPKKVRTATLTCPEGKRAVSGGAQCGSGFSWSNGVAKFLTNGMMGGQAPGAMVASEPTPDGKGWSVACCIEGVPTDQSKAYVVCE